MGNMEQVANTRLEVWNVYNQLFKEKFVFDDEETLFNQNNIKWLIEHYKDRFDHFSHGFFELNRLLGCKEVCQQMLDTYTFDNYVAYREKRCGQSYCDNDIQITIMKKSYQTDFDLLNAALNSPDTIIYPRNV